MKEDNFNAPVRGNEYLNYNAWQSCAGKCLLTEF